MRLQKTRNFIIETHENKLPCPSYYHGIDHAFDVEDACLEITKDININKTDLELLRVTALLHDIEHASSEKDHEKLACNFVIEKFNDLGYSDQEIDTISSLIMATKLPHKPKNLLEMVICDADLSYIGKGSYYKKASKLRLELINGNKKELKNDETWILFQLDFLNKHVFFTEFAKNHYNAEKNNIIANLNLELKKEVK